MILATTAFDTDEPEGSEKSIHISKKDLKIIGVVVVVLGIVMIPIYNQLKEDANQHVCQQNLTQVSKAIGLYAASNDDRLPPVYATAAPQVPYLDAKNEPFTWTSLVARYMNERASFVCPSAQPDEYTYSQHPDSSKKSLLSTYGMYLPFGGYLLSHISNPDDAILLGETSNAGSQGSFDPMPFKDLAGKAMAQDGFAIGWSDGNVAPTKDTVSVTRLAYRDTKGGEFKDKGLARHKKGVFLLSVSGSLRMAPPAAAKVTMRGAEIQGSWSAPPPDR